MHSRRRALAASISAVIVAILLPTATATAGPAPDERPAAVADPAPRRPVEGGTAAGTAVAGDDDGSVYVPITPCRIADTRRSSAGPLGATKPQRTYSATRIPSIRAQGGSNAGCGIPTTATAVVAAFSAVSPKAHGYLRSWPVGSPVVTATLLNFRAGSSATNTATVPVSGGALEVRVTSNRTTDVVVDITGYHLATGASPRPPAASIFVPVEPCRLVDTRGSSVDPLTPSRPQRAFTSAVGFPEHNTQGEDGYCGAPAAATAIVASITVVDPEAAGYLRAWPNGRPEPRATLLNFNGRKASVTTGNTVPVDRGWFDIKVVSAADVDVVVDLAGYYVPTRDAPETPSLYRPVRPCRIADTRRSAAGPFQRRGAARRLAVAGADLDAQGGAAAGCGIPVGATAVNATISAVEPAGVGYVRAWPAGRPEPNFTVLNAGRVGASVTSGATLPLSADGAIQVRTATRGATHVVVDVTGYHVPAPEPPQLSGVTALSAGTLHSCALMADRTVRCWGDDRTGQLGIGFGDEWGEPAPVPVTGLTDVVQITAGTLHTCARSAALTLRCWGDNTERQLGAGTTAAGTPRVVAGLSDVRSVSAGSAHTCAVLGGGQVRCWGNNEFGQTGTGPASATDVATPTAVVGVTDAVAVAAGWAHTCALRAGGTVACWGANATGQLGIGSTVATSTPTTVTGLADVTSIAAGADHSCALTDVGGAWCWGSNELGQLGNTAWQRSLVPTAVIRFTPWGGTAPPVIELSAGGGHTCGRTDTGALRCFGDNEYGQIGNGSSGGGGDSGTPFRVATASTVAAGGAHTCAVAADGGVWCWGLNVLGQVGNGSRGSVEPVVQPVRVDAFASP